MTLTPYLVFNGEAEEAANFYAGVLGGKIENFHRYGEMPPMEGMPPVPDELRNQVLHCCIDFPGGSLSLADTMPTDPRNFGNGGHLLTFSTDTPEQAQAAWDKLSVGVQRVACPFGEAFFAKRYGEVVDRFGVQWAVMCE